MKFNVFKNTVLLFVLVMISCASKVKNNANEGNQIIKEVFKDSSLIVGANQTELYLPLLKGKRVGIVANQTSVVFKKETDHISFTHVVDSLIALKVDIKKVFAPEHGFRGKADAGEVVKDGIDTKTNLPIVSLYGKNKKPSAAQLKNLDVVVFDIQDVGARFYTYISSLHYVMEACAEAGIPVIIFDRPNPNGHYIDGPILEMEHKSFVGMHPIPIVHGMTIGEYAKMINGEKWLANGAQCNLKVIPIKNYNHKLSYSLPIKPSPNLPNDQAINLYTSLCFFEGTNVSAGRGTDMQFQIFGSPFLNNDIFNFEFIPQPNEGSKYPKHQNKTCYGKDLTKVKALNNLNLEWLIEAYNHTENKSEFFNAFFIKLAGTNKLKQQIEAGLTADAIKDTWKDGLEDFNETRKTYLIYP
ncbi:exo-beta-N-acetylmuramidase NamZ domain-containing protein [Algibacter sp. R77976]|uniref:exo-beta-N-acetylmuramidase NamZ family protein n=1 Tax=Algibacter sp. R77976 TaxID=3093873 RepID=UPI0037C829B7